MAEKELIDEKVQKAKTLININEDSRQYFYENADEDWLKWLWENGFFDVLKKKAEDTSKFTYRTPELRYLVRMAVLQPKVVTEIMLEIPIKKETFNPEVIAQFLNICECLHGEQLARMIEKITIEKWPALMQNFDQWGMDYQQMFKILAASDYHEELLNLASTVLDIRDDWKDITKNEYSDATPFCLAHLSYSKVFHYLSTIDENYIEDAIDLVISILKRLTTFSEEHREASSVFPQKDRYPLYDVDIFIINLRSEYHGSGREDVREIVALLKNLAERILMSRCQEKAMSIFEQYFLSLPDSWLMWRIRLFVLSLCPSELMFHLKEALFRIFKENRYSELIMGAEYKKALIKAFPFMGKNDQTRYVDQAKHLFSHASDENELSKKRQDGSRIFSVIGIYLSDEQVNELIYEGFEIISGYIPVPIIGMVKSGFVRDKGPVTQEEFRSYKISEIVHNLKGVWSPARLIEQDVERDFLNPLNAEGMGNLLKNDVKTRLQEYLEYSCDFIDRENLDLRYLYSLLSGFVNALDENIVPLKNTDWEMLINFCLRIIQSGKGLPEEQFVNEINQNDAWLGRWNAVNDAMITLIKMILGEKGKELGFEWKSHRYNIISLVEYWFGYPDPIPEDEQIGSQKITERNGDQKPDPFTKAINSIRGQAFKLFVLAVELDTESDGGLINYKISKDLKRLYENLLNKEETRAIKFMFGHYIPMIFFREKNWLKSLLEKMFPTGEGKEYLYLAAWEGFLTNPLSVEIFRDREFIKLYKWAIEMSVKDYPHQRHFTEPDEGLAQHFALAYMVTDFEFGNEFFEYFWTNGNIDQHTAFIDALGRIFVSGEEPRIINLLNEDKNAGKKIKNMWCWLLDNYSEPGVFEGIGFWIDLEKGIFQANELAENLVKTLNKTNGYLKWDIKLQENIVALAKKSPEQTVDIVRLYLLEGCVRKGLNSVHYFLLDKKWTEVFHILYTQAATKQATISLINDLIREGGNYFWPLKEILKNT